MDRRNQDPWGKILIMYLLAFALTAAVAVSHFGFMILEMFYWDRPIGRKVFSVTPEVSKASAVLAANQGLYNGFLVAGLVWALFADRLGKGIEWRALEQEHTAQQPGRCNVACD